MDLIPMDKIDPEARKLAVVWCEVYIPHFAMQEKHKLASDIMNYAKQFNKINKMSNTTEITKQQNEVAKQLDLAVLQVIGQDNIIGFQKAFQVAEATKVLKEVLNEDYMKPIMLLQGSRLGFKTDKDTSGGYHSTIVKQCLIEAVLTGVQPSMNQFNIIAGNMYVTKEGFGYLLSKIQGLTYEIVPFIPKVEGNQATIVMKITWSLNGARTEVRENEFAIKVNNFMGADAIIGKATRKARAWLYNTITGVEVSEGDASDIEIKASNTVPITSTPSNDLSPQAEKVADSTKIETEKAKEKKAKAEALAGKKSVTVPESVEDAKVISESEPSDVTYKEFVLKMTPSEIVAELKEKLPYITKEAFEGVSGQKLNAKTAQTLLIDFNDNILEVTLDKIYGISSDKLKAFNTEAPKTEEKVVEPTANVIENDPMTQMAINDEIIEGELDIDEVALGMNYASSEDLLKFGTLRATAEYVKSKKA